jgi:hypothetical protein
VYAVRPSSPSRIEPAVLGDLRIPAVRAVAIAATLAFSVGATIDADAAGRSFLKPLALGSDNYAESFSFVADLEDGGYVLLQLGVSNIGPGKGHGICRGLYVPSAGAKWNVSTLERNDGWRYDATRDRLEVGGCSAELAADATIVTVALDGGRAELRFGARPSSTMPPGADIKLGGGRHRTELWFTRAPVTLQLTLGDAAPKAIAGAGYADHAASDLDPLKLARSWVRFRALRRDAPVLLLARQPLEGDTWTPAWSWQKGAFTPLPRALLTREGEGEATRFVAELADASGKTWTARATRLLHRHAPVAELGGGIGRLLTPFVGSPVSYTFRGTLDDGGGPIDGLFEVELGDE